MRRKCVEQRSSEAEHSAENAVDAECGSVADAEYCLFMVIVYRATLKETKNPAQLMMRRGRHRRFNHSQPLTQNAVCVGLVFS